MKKVLLIFIISLFHSVNAQGYNFEEYKRFKKIVNTCDSLEEYSKSIVYYDSMFSTINFYPYDYFYAFKTAWKNGDSIKANN